MLSRSTSGSDSPSTTSRDASNAATRALSPTPCGASWGTVLLNRVERALMNNPIRGFVQRHFEARRLLRLGGPMPGGRALEIGCGRGVGATIIHGAFGADSVHAFDLDPYMVSRARQRLATHDPRPVVWVGDASAISVPDSSYDAVFDFGIIHHVPDWHGVLKEIFRVLRPGALLYAEEVLSDFIAHPITRHLFDHPQDDRFGAVEFGQGLETAGFEVLEMEELWSSFAWFAARKPRPRPPGGR